MTSADTHAMTVLQALLDERQRYERWIHTLEQRQGVTAPHVYSRVHTDYMLRLEQVLKRLAEQTEDLRAIVQTLASRLADLRGREAERIDARQEAELRAVVGEYEEEHWNHLREEADREIALIAEERRGVEEEFSEMERIMKSAGGAALSGQDSAVTSGSAHEEMPSVDAASQYPSSKIEQVPVLTTASATSQSSGHKVASIPDFLASGQAAASSPPSLPTDSVLAQRNEHLGRTPESDASHVREDGVTPQRRVPPPVPAQDAAAEPGHDQEKTLKCPECGTMNYATEWYCERCGGELATF